MNNPPCTFSIVVPVFNEEAVLPEFHKRLYQIMKSLHEPFEIMYVNDGSTDTSGALLKEYARTDSTVKIVSFSRNFGHQLALTAGLTKARGQAVITIDADLQDPPELITILIDKWKAGYDVVYAVRTRREGENFIRMSIIQLFYSIIKHIAKIDIPLNSGDFRLFSRRAVDSLNRAPERSRWLRGLSAWIGYKQIGVDYVRSKRFAGKSKYSFAQLCKFALEGITSFSALPLRLAIYLGLIISIVSTACVLVLLYNARILHNPVEGWLFVLGALFFMGGVQLCIIGIMGEYVGRIYEESKQRPLYIIEEEVNVDSCPP